MPSSEEIQHYLTGAWRVILGKPDGLRLFDVSADGFWNSFFAMVVAFPPLVVGWVGMANELAAFSGDFGSRLSIVLRLATIDFAIWVVPVVALALVARRAGLADRFVQLVVASNWASALFVWATVPVPLFAMIWTMPPDVRNFLSLGLLLLNIFVFWRVTNVALGKGAAVATAVFAGMFVLAVTIQILLMSAFGLSLGPAV